MTSAASKALTLFILFPSFQKSEYYHIHPLKIASRQAGCPQALCFHAIFAANAQTWLNGNIISALNAGNNMKLLEKSCRLNDGSPVNILFHLNCVGIDLFQTIVPISLIHHPLPGLLCRNPLRPLVTAKQRHRRHENIADKKEDHAP